MLIMVHKPNNPGKPMISAVDTPTKFISEIVVHTIKRIPPTLRSFAIDMTHFFTIINDINSSDLTKESYLVTIDVSFLHTNFQRYDGLPAAKFSLSH